MSIPKQIKASAVVLTGLSSGVAIAMTNDTSAYAETTSTKATSSNDQGVTSLTTTVQTISYITEKGKVVGTGKITAEDTAVDGKKVTNYSLDSSIPAGYKLKDGQDLKQLPHKLVVESLSGNASDESTQGDASNTKKNKSKTVTYVDKSGKVVGTGKITSSFNDDDGSTTYFVDKTIPAGYKLESDNAVIAFLDKLTVIADPNSKETSSASVTIPVQATGTSGIKRVKCVDENGKIVGTGAVSAATEKYYNKVVTHWNADIPAGYKLKNPEDIRDNPDQLVVVPISANNSNGDQSGNANNAGSNTDNGTSRTDSGKNNTESQNNGAKNSESSTTTTNLGAEGSTNGTSNASNSGNNAAFAKNNSTSDNSDEQNNSEINSESNDNSLVDDDADVDPDEEENKDKGDDTGTDEGQKAVTTTTKKVVPDSSEATSAKNGSTSTASNTLPQTGNARTESRLAVGVGLLAASMTAAGIAKKKLS